jgi:hypothetical protein
MKGRRAAPIFVRQILAPQFNDDQLRLQTRPESPGECWLPVIDPYAGFA